MADIKTFCCIRPKEGMAARIAALPYDVYSREEARQKVLGDADSFLRIDRPETQFPEDYDMYAPEVYDKAAQLFQEMLEDGRYVRDDEEAYYVYQLIMDERVQNGIVACASIDDYRNQVIRKHENTREDKEQDRIRHVDRLNAQTGPIFLAYRAQPRITALLNEIVEETPLYSFTAEDGIMHNVFRVGDAKRIAIIREAFAGMDALYIADGHHRAASAVKVGQARREQHPGYDGTEEFNYFLSVLFADEQLRILPYNRVVRDLNGHSVPDFLEQVQKHFSLAPASQAVSPKEKGSFGMYLDGCWYALRAHADVRSQDPVEGLDVALLQRELLEPVLGIVDPRTDDRIDFVGGIRGLAELERRCQTDMQVAFSMYPTSIAELFAVADAGKLMPPKSTWFEPKLRSGIFIHSI